MEHRFKKALSTVAFAAVMAMSVVGICKQMLTVCGFGCTHEEMSMCDMNTTACSGEATDHMTTFASLYPSNIADSAGALLVLCVICIVAWSFRANDGLIDAERLGMRIKNYIRNLTHTFIRNFFVFAVRKGILHSKIYA